MERFNWPSLRLACCPSDMRHTESRWQEIYMTKSAAHHVHNKVCYCLLTIQKYSKNTPARSHLIPLLAKLSCSMSMHEVSLAPAAIEASGRVDHSHSNCMQHSHCNSLSTTVSLSKQSYVKSMLQVYLTALAKVISCQHI